MSLRTQFFTSFLLVAILPLVIFSVYLLQTNLLLAFDLHRQNLYNSTAIQADVVEEYINRLMVRATRMVNSRPVRAAFKKTPSAETLFETDGLSDELLKFTDETLDSIRVFALALADGTLLYATGSNNDIRGITAELPSLEIPSRQYIREIPLGGRINNLSVVTPILVNGTVSGMFIAVFNNEFFLKAISGHRQIKSSNSFIFCRKHNVVVESKSEITGSLADFSEKVASGTEGSFQGKINGVKSVAEFKLITGSHWILANEIPHALIYSRILPYALLSTLVFLLSLLIIILLARRQSRRILNPLTMLLSSVERFFMSGANRFVCDGIDRKTEIGYLQEKFEGMAQDIALVQAKLKESNYLYDALLHSAYELQISIDYNDNTVFSSEQEVIDFCTNYPDLSAPERIMLFFTNAGTSQEDCDLELLKKIVFGNLQTPVEMEIHCLRIGKKEDVWYRIVPVPIQDENGFVRKMVLHFKNITADKREIMRLLHSSQRDPLCGLLNKKAFISLIEQFSVTKRGTNTVFFVDLDNFKTINDCLGHAAGDELLVETAKILVAHFRATDFIARYGGDEFVVFTSGMSRSAVSKKAQSLVDSLVFDRHAPDGGTIRTSASVGVFISKTVSDVNMLVEHADAAMYRAKHQGKSGYCISEQEEEHSEQDL